MRGAALLLSLRRDIRLLCRQTLPAGVAARFGNPGFFIPKSVLPALTRGIGLDIARCHGTRPFFSSFHANDDARRGAFRAELRLAHLILPG